MSLASIKRKSVVVDYPGEGGEVTKITLGALTLTSLATLLNRNQHNIDALWQLWQKLAIGNLDLSDGDITRLLSSVVMEFPYLVADIIAAANMPAVFTAQQYIEAADGARNLDFATQVDWFMKVYAITVTEVGGIKNLMGLIAGLKSEAGNLKKA